MPNTLLIRGAMVYDGTGSAPVQRDIAVAGDRIVDAGAVGELGEHQTIDATGLSLAPGFINPLSHAYDSLVTDPHGTSDLLQGVTTQVFGEGLSLGPMTPQLAELIGLDSDSPQALDCRLSEALTGYQRRGVSQNVASFVGAHNLRMLAAGSQDRQLSATELDTVGAVLAEELEDGALGLGSALIYPPGSFADTAELVHLATVVGRHGGLYISHIRNESAFLLDAISELIDIGSRGQVRCEVHHLKAAGAANWQLMPQAIKLIQQARDSGQPISANMYPYSAAETSLSAIIPPQFHEGGAPRLLARLADPAIREQIEQAILETGEKSYEDLYAHSGGAGGVVLLDPAALPDGLTGAGLSLAEVAERLRLSPIACALELIQRNPQTAAAYYCMTEENVSLGLAQPWVSICSDADTGSLADQTAATSTHPRSHGSFARFLGRYVRDQQLVPLTEAIRRMTSLPADNLKLADRGRIAEGAFADLVIFDPLTVGDLATFAEPRRFATGVRDVIVNGELALRAGVPTAQLPGRALRRATAGIAQGSR